MKPELQVGEGLEGVNLDGSTIEAPNSSGNLAGMVTAKAGEMSASARIRMFDTDKTWKWDFEGYKGVQVPSHWLRAFAKLKPVDLDGNTVMKAAGIGSGKGRPSHTVWLGSSDMKDYTIQADVMMKEQRRQLPDIGLVANRYNLILKGNRSKLRIQSWAPHLRMAKEQKFLGDPDVWYTMKMKVEIKENQAHVYGKVWKKGEAEPNEWTIEATDPHPNETGSPGLYVYATTDCHFDNVVVNFAE